MLNISLGSLGESVSGLYSYRKAKHISEEQFERLDAQAYKIENGLLKLVESLEKERDKGDWILSGRSNGLMENAKSNTPVQLLQYSMIPFFDDSNTQA